MKSKKGTVTMYKMLRKIKALFNFKGELKEMVVDHAEIKKDCVYLHPADDPDHTFRIKTESVDILINPDGEVSEDDIFMMDNKKEQ
jgi:hypothetical protein